MSIAVLIRRSTSARWLSNSWLVASGRGPAVVIDAGAPAEPLLQAAREAGASIELVLLTHHHEDHVCERHAFAPAACAMHVLDAGHVDDISREVRDKEVVQAGDLSLTMLHVPGHTLGQLNVLVAGPEPPAHLFTGDTLFRGSVGGTRSPGHGTFPQLRHSILDRLLTLPGDTIVHPGHGEDTTVATELAENPFVRAWLGTDPELGEPCVALGEPATLLTWARDYDGGFKAWVRWPGGSMDVVPGSRVKRA